MATASIQPSFAAGEISPELFGRVDLAKYHSGASTMRNFFASYRGGAISRAGTKFVGQSFQGSCPPSSGSVSSARGTITLWVNPVGERSDESADLCTGNQIIFELNASDFSHGVPRMFIAVTNQGIVTIPPGEVILLDKVQIWFGFNNVLTEGGGTQVTQFMTTSGDYANAEATYLDMPPDGFPLAFSWDFTGATWVLGMWKGNTDGTWTDIANYFNSIVATPPGSSPVLGSANNLAVGTAMEAVEQPIGLYFNMGSNQGFLPNDANLDFPPDDPFPSRMWDPCEWCQSWFGFGQALDMSLITNARKFWDDTSSPKWAPISLGSNGSLPTGQAPTFYFRRGLEATYNSDGTTALAMPIYEVVNGINTPVAPTTAVAATTIPQATSGYQALGVRFGVNNGAAEAFTAAPPVNPNFGCDECSPAPPRVINFQFRVDQSYALEFGDHYMRVIANGALITNAPFAISGATNAYPCVVTAVGSNYNVGDAVFITGMQGMTELNGQTFFVSAATTDTFTIQYFDGNPVDATGFGVYTSGGEAATIFFINTPWAAEDLKWLKFTQSQDVMTICCVNQDTGVEYPPYNLARIALDNWTITQETFASSIAAPASASAFATTTTGGGNAASYAYVVTALSDKNSDESVASPIAGVTDSVDISITAGSIVINWSPVTGAASYNIYKAPTAYQSTVPVGSLFGFCGGSLGLSFVDSNIVADFTTTPPIHNNPFAQSTILEVNMVTFGSGYTSGSTVNVISGAGFGFSGAPVILNGQIQAVLINDGGEDYLSTDTVVFTGTTGSTASAVLVIGAATGTFPGVVSYFQQRRVYAASLNQPDTYWMSQPGSFENMDSAIPPIDSDSITGTPWSQQLNGVQFMVNMPGGLVVLTGLGAWQVTGGVQVAITPADQNAQPQAYNGCNNAVPPIVVNYDILYVQEKGSIVRDLAYNFFTNIYTGTDLTVLAGHLFLNHTIVQWAWAEEPYKLIWCVRDDGIMLCLTYIKEQDIWAWSRHDTNGQFVSVCSTSEPPVNAVYVVVRRWVQGKARYYIERMDNRLWTDIEQAWCVDCALSLDQPQPVGCLSPGLSTGDGVTFVSDGNVFDPDDVGSVLRMGGGIANIVSYVSPTTVMANIVQPITAVLPNDLSHMPIPALPGQWSMTAPVTMLSNLFHLEGKTVTGLADGGVIPPQVVTDGKITLDTPASAVIVGLPFQAQLQTLYMDVPAQDGSTVQGRRKDIYAVTVRMQASRGAKVGTNQPDQSTQPDNAAPDWTNMILMKTRGPTVHAGRPIPLLTGDFRTNVKANWAKPGQVAVQVDDPLPLTVLALIPEAIQGDSADAR